MEGIMRVAAVLLSFAFFLSLNLELGLAAKSSPSGSTEFIRTCCSTTSYPSVCLSSLARYANEIQTSHRLMVNASLSVTLNEARSTSAVISKLSTRAGLKPGEIAAMADCVENIGDSVDEIRRSIGEMGQLQGNDLRMHMSNMQTWVSAALTDDVTCMDCFAGNKINGNLKNTVRARVLKVAHMTSNALSLINSLASTPQGSQH